MTTNGTYCSNACWMAAATVDERERRRRLRESQSLEQAEPEKASDR
jgi:hypothetical protein